MSAALLIGDQIQCAALSLALGELAIQTAVIPGIGSRASVAESAVATRDVDLVVIPVAALDSPPNDLADLSAVQWEQMCEIPLRQARIALQAGHQVLRDRGGSIVFIVPTSAMAGAEGYVATAALVEGVRALGKSAAAAWVDEGIKVNFLAVPEATLRDEALLRTEVAPLVALLARSGPTVTGSTLVADRGTLMVP